VSHFIGFPLVNYLHRELNQKNPSNLDNRGDWKLVLEFIEFFSENQLYEVRHFPRSESFSSCADMEVLLLSGSLV
jgi:hypothetical protein